MAGLAMGYGRRARSQAADDIQTEGWALVVLCLALSCGSVGEPGLEARRAPAVVESADAPADAGLPVAGDRGDPAEDAPTPSHSQPTTQCTLDEARALFTESATAPRRASESRRGDLAVAARLGGVPETPGAR